MTGTKLHWVEGPWAGRLALAARPRGGDWLEMEMESWRGNGVDTVVSLLEASEEGDLELGREGVEARLQGMRFKSLPIGDRQVPGRSGHFSASLDEMDGELSGGRSVLVHCRQGIGRTGLVAACLLMIRGFAPEAAISRVSGARGLEIPETAEQRAWIESFAAMFAAAR